jgi:hypothetical protein
MKFAAIALFTLLLIASVMLLGGKRTPSLPTTIPDPVENALASPNKITLYSLTPAGNDWKGTNSFHGYRVLGKVMLEGEEAFQVANEFKQAVFRADGSMASCFNPRHGLQVADKTHTFDFVLCYECRQMEVYENNKKIADLGAKGSPSLLNEILIKKNVPLSKQ